MGNSGSRAAQSSVRKFPTRAPGAVPTSAPRAAPRSAPKASTIKDEAIRDDATRPEQFDSIDQAYSDRLRQMGVVQPNPTFSPSSTASNLPDVSQYAPLAPNFPAVKNNRTLGTLEARRRLQDQAATEFNDMGKSAGGGREFLDVATIRDILTRRQRGEKAGDIESKLMLRAGVVSRLGPLGVVSTLNTQN